MTTTVPTLEIVTPSYAPDLELCHDLVGSLADSTVAVRHRVIVPAADLDAFAVALPTTVDLDPVSGYLPDTMRRLPGNLMINLRRPWPPIRGWIAQQIVKLEAARRSTADVVLLVDSDTYFLAPVSAADFLSGGRVRLYRLDAHIDGRLPRHVEWHRTARRLLGLPPDLVLPAPDYICWPCAWDPTIVTAMLDRIEAIHGRPWATTLGAQLHFSEMILYGVYVDAFVPEVDRPVTAEMRAVHHSEELALNRDDLRFLLDGLRPHDLAVMISAKSSTDLSLRRELLAGHPTQHGRATK